MEDAGGKPIARESGRVKLKGINNVTKYEGWKWK